MLNVIGLLRRFYNLFELQIQPRKNNVFIYVAVNKYAIIGLPVIRQGDTTSYIAHTVHTGSLIAVNFQRALVKYGGDQQAQVS